MNELERWFAKEARRERRAVYLEEALLGNRFWHYAWYRLRYFFARYAVATLTHALTVLLLYRFFDRTHFVAVLVAYAVASVVSSFWWGSLEAMRTDVRRLYRLRAPHRIPACIGGWLSLSLQLMLLTGAGTLLWLAAHLLRGGSLKPATLYVCAIGIRLALQFFTRAYHSGIYAIRRVYRPLPAIVGVEFAGIGITVAFAPLLGAWALPLGALAGALVVTGLSLHYTRKAYWFLGLSPAPYVRVTGLHLPARRVLRDFVGGGFSYALMAVDALVVLVLFTTEDAAAGKTGLFALFFLISPTIRATFEWSQLMYFDLKRLEIRLFRNLKRRFERSVRRLAVVLGALFAGAAALIGSFVYDGSAADLAWTLVPFFVSVSLLAALQIDAYADRAYPALIGNGLFCLVGYAGVARLSTDDRATVLLLGTVALAGFGLLLLRRTTAGLATDESLLPFASWLTALGAIDHPVRLTVARFSPDPWTEDDGWRREQIGMRIVRGLGRRARATAIEPDLIAWYDTGDEDSSAGGAGFPSASGGLLEWVGSRRESDGRSAIRAAARAGLLGREPAQIVRRARRPLRTDELRAAFESMFTSGIVYAPDEPVPARLDALPAEEKRAALVHAIAFAKELRLRPARTRYETTALCEDGRLRLVFLVSRRAPERLRSRWERMIRQANLEAAMRPSETRRDSPGGNASATAEPRAGRLPALGTAP